MKITLTLFMLLYFTLSGLSQCVNDTIPPLISCNNSNLVLNAAGIASASPYLIAGISSDNCPGLITRLINGQALDTFDCSHLGSNTAVATSIDLAGNSSSCVATITVIDTMVPVISCVNSNLVLNAAGIASASPYLIAGISSDNCGIATLLINGQTLDTFDCSHLGNNTAVLTATDLSGNTSSCVATITVIDTMVPVVSCQNITVPLSNLGFASIPANTLADTIYDNCGINSFLINGLPNASFTCADIGTNIAVLSVTDLSGNTSTCASTVTILDTITPIASCNSTTAYLSNTGLSVIYPTQIDNGSSDNCGIASMKINGQDSMFFNCADIGVQTITLTVVDLSGNTSTCASTVTILDTIDPIASCNTTTAYLSNTGLSVIYPTQIDNGSSDNCGIGSMQVNGQDSIFFSCANIGVQTITLTVIDLSGNTSTCASTVTILDTIDPIASCNTTTTAYLSNTGLSVIYPTQIDNGSSDNCGIGSMQVNGQDSMFFSCADIGVQTITLIVVDLSGNTSACASTVTILDTIAPIASCSNTTVYLSNTGLVVVSPSDINSGSSDNCSILSYLINGQLSDTFNCNDLDSNLAILTVTDTSGNTGSCSSTINVIDSAAFCALSATTISQTESMIRVYPNPVSSILNIESKKGSIQQLSLTSLAGQLILDKNSTNSPNSLTLDLSSFPNAVYLLTIITEEGRFTEKIILQR